MTTGGWLMMTVSLCFVWGLVGWCFWKVMTTPNEEKVPPGYGP